jgi:hypothetical protein
MWIASNTEKIAHSHRTTACMASLDSCIKRLSNGTAHESKVQVYCWRSLLQERIQIFKILSCHVVLRAGVLLGCPGPTSIGRFSLRNPRVSMDRWGLVYLPVIAIVRLCQQLNKIHSVE